MKAALTALLFLFCAQPLYAEVPYMGFFQAVARELDIPMPVALAIAKVESELMPWSLNVEGRSFRFASKDAALAQASAARIEGRSFDVGLMQINNWWLDRYGISLETAFDPLANIYFGSWIFKQELIRHKNLRAAIGAYHSPNPLRANRYADQVMKALAKGPVNQNTSQSTVATKTVPATPKPKPSAPRRLPATEPATFKVGRNLDNSMKVSKK